MFIMKWKKTFKQAYATLSVLFPLAVDLALVYLMFNAAYLLRFHAAPVVRMFPVIKGVPSWAAYHHAILGISLLFGGVFVFSGMYYRKFVSGFDEFVQIVKSVTLATIAVMALTFLYREFEYSRLVILCAWLLTLCAVYVFHAGLRLLDNYYLYRFFGRRRVLVVGNGKTTAVFKRFYARRPKYRAYYYAELPSLEKLARFVRARRIDELIITSMKVRHDELSEISNICDEYSVDLRLVPDVLEIRMGELIIDSSFGLPLLRIKPVSLYGVNKLIKRAFDILVSIAILSITAIPLIFIAVLILMESRGSVFYVKKRVGYRGIMFPFFKFRSMVSNADFLLKDLKSLSERDGPVFKMKKDPRLTRIGAILRMLSLDELPQLINVLRGEMSIVGPRPQVIWEAEAYDQYARKRLNVLPGITGLWQVSGRASLSYEDMIRLDIFYIENWSLGLDLKILLETIPTVLSGKGAY